VSLSSRECFKEYSSWTKWPNGLEGREGPFIASQGNLPIGGVRDPDMSELGAGHVRQHSLESGLDTRHVRFHFLEPGIGAG
jgi:hypothetical protein